MREARVRFWMVLIPLALCALATEVVLACLGLKPFDSTIQIRGPIGVSREADPCRASGIDEMMRKSIHRKITTRKHEELGFTTNLQPLGFNDSKDFYGSFEDRERFLMLGDSFTFGASAPRGRGWVDLLNRANQPAGPLFFNTGIGGYGQVNQLAVLKKYCDVIRPHAVFLLFCSFNDFEDNLLPLKDGYIYADGRLVTPKYDVQTDFDSIRLTEKDPEQVRIQFRRMLGCPDGDREGRSMLGTVKAAIREKLFFSSRLGSLIWMAADMVKSGRPRFALGAQRLEVEEGGAVYGRTRGLLAEIQTYLADRNIPLYAAVIPDNTVRRLGIEKTRNHLMAERVLAELRIPVLELHPNFKAADYASRWPLVYDMHWNKRGHQKMFRIFSDCLNRRKTGTPGAFCLDADRGGDPA